MPARPKRGFRHGLRVRIDGERGVLFECRSRRPAGGLYWMVRLQRTNRWVWPDGIIVDRIDDGRPDELAPDDCASCELPFYRRVGSGEILCDRCTAEQFGTATRARDPADAAPRSTFDGKSHYKRR
jgi:ribosomal protein L37AE/L43A